MRQSVVFHAESKKRKKCKERWFEIALGATMRDPQKTDQDPGQQKHKRGKKNIECKDKFWET